MAKPLVSVVIDNYNYGRFLGQCLQSVLDQDYPKDRLEIIVVDDGSTDDSREVAARFKPRVTLIAQENKGQAGAFNTGFAAAQGDIVCMMDSDDYWEPDKVSSVAAAFEGSDAGIVQHYLRDVDISGRPLNNPIPPWPPYYEVKDYLDGKADLAATTGLAFRRDILKKITPIPSEVFNFLDVYLQIKGMFLAPMRNLPRILGYHRIHGGNNWAQTFMSPKKLEWDFQQLESFKRNLAPELAKRGLSYSPHYLYLERLETGRRKVLLASHKGRRREALGHWRDLWKGDGKSGLGFFRSASLLLAVISPKLYLKTYDFYGNQHWLVGLRRKVFRG